MYQVETLRLNETVKRNIKCFPLYFMFQLNRSEFDLIFQNGTSSWGGTHKLPYAFTVYFVQSTSTEHGVAMLAGLLNSQKAIDVNIDIVRAFVVLRQYALGYAELNQRFLQASTTARSRGAAWRSVRYLTGNIEVKY